MRTVALLLILVPAAVRASGGGSSGAEFLRIGMGARPAALGESFTGLADDVTAAAWNPAGLGRLTRVELSAMHMMYVQDMSYEFLAASVPIGGVGTLAISGAYLNVPPFDSTAPGSNLPKGSAGDGVGSVSWGMSLAPFLPDDPDYEHLFFGVTGKFIYRSLSGYAPTGGAGETYTAMSGAGDFGFLYAWTPAVTVGASMMNLGKPVTFLGDEADALPLSVRAGVGWRALTGKWFGLTLLADVVKPVDADGGAFESGTWGGAGMEAVIGGVLSLRGGFRQAADGTRVVGGGGISLAGIGVDYAFVPMEALGTVHRMGLTVKIGRAYSLLPVPSDVAGEPMPGGKAILHWSPVRNASGYMVDMKKPDQADYRRITPRPRAAPEIPLGGLALGAEYAFRVVAVDGEGHEGRPAFGTIRLPLPPPDTFTATATTKGKVTLSWKAVPGAAGYHISEKQADGRFRKITKNPFKGTRVGLKGIKAGLSQFAVASVDANGKESRSKIAKVTVR